MTKRTGWITGVVILYSLEVIVMAGTSAYCLWLTRTPEILKEPEAATGLKVGAAVSALPAAILLIALPGLWKVKLWGWWLALLVNLSSTLIFVFNLFDWNAVDAEDVEFAVGFAIMLVPLLLPPVIKSFWRDRKPAKPAAVTEMTGANL